MTVHELLDMPWFAEWLASQKAAPVLASEEDIGHKEKAPAAATRPGP
jgi:hypothetical protein